VKNKVLNNQESTRFAKRLIKKDQVIVDFQLESYEQELDSMKK